MAEKDDDIEIPQGFGITDENFNEKEEIEKLKAFRLALMRKYVEPDEAQWL